MSYAPPNGQLLTPYICPRDASKAIAWYVEVFGATETSERFVDPDGRVGHAEIALGGTAVMLSDAYPDYGAVAPEAGNRTATFALSLFVPDADATVAAAAQAGATIQRPVADQFHGARMGTIIDPFGVRWMISTQVRSVADADIAAEAKKFTGAKPGPVS